MRLRHRRHHTLGVDRAANWPRTEQHRSRPRVLLEVKDPAEAMSYWRYLDRHGYEMSWCPGPTESSSCALVVDGHCPLLEHADVVLTALNPEDPYARPVLERLHDQCPVTPTIAVTRPTATKRWSALFEHFTVLDPFRVRRDLLPALVSAEVRSRNVPAL